MCFSAGASFGAAAILGGTGIVAAKKAQGTQLFLAMIPLLFSAQQFSEGVLWLASTQQVSSVWERPAMYFFLAFAQVVWPLWVPLSFLRMEQPGTRRKTLFVLSVAGVLFAIYGIFCLSFYHVSVEPSHHHLNYRLDFPSLIRPYFTSVIYFIVTILPPFVSSVRRASFVGLATLISFLASAFFFPAYLISVWCYFAATISIAVLAVLYYRESLHGKIHQVQ